MSQITVGVSYPNVPGAKTLKEARPLYLGNVERVSVNVSSDYWVTLFIGTRKVSSSALSDIEGVTTDADLMRWAAENAISLQKSYDEGYVSVWADTWDTADQDIETIPVEEPEEFTSTCLTCGNVKQVEGPWNESVAYCADCVAKSNKAFEEARELGMDHGEAWDYANSTLTKPARSCEQCGSHDDVRSFQLFRANKHDSGIVDTCKPCRDRVEAATTPKSSPHSGGAWDYYRSRKPQGKLSSAQRQEISQRLSAGEKVSDLALEYGVTTQTIRRYR